MHRRTSGLLKKTSLNADSSGTRVFTSCTRLRDPCHGRGREHVKEHPMSQYHYQNTNAQSDRLSCISKPERTKSDSRLFVCSNNKASRERDRSKAPQSFLRRIKEEITASLWRWSRWRANQTSSMSSERSDFTIIWSDAHTLMNEENVSNLLKHTRNPQQTITHITAPAFHSFLCQTDAWFVFW